MSVQISNGIPSEHVEVVQQAVQDASLHWHYAGLETALLKQERVAEVEALLALKALGNQLVDCVVLAAEMDAKLANRTEGLESLGIRADGDPKISAWRDEAGNLRARKRQIEAVFASLCKAVRPWEAVER